MGPSHSAGVRRAAQDLAAQLSSHVGRATVQGQGEVPSSVLGLALLGRELACGFQMPGDKVFLGGRSARLVPAVLHGVLALSLGANMVASESRQTGRAEAAQSRPRWLTSVHDRSSVE